MAALRGWTNRWRRRPLVAWSVAIAAALSLAWVGYLGFGAVRWALIDFQAFSRWEHGAVEADKRAIDTTILPAIEAYTRREGVLPTNLDRLVVSGDLAYVPASQAGEWFFTVRQDAFTIGVGDPPHDYPCAYRVIEFRAPNDADPDGWRVRDWYHDS